ncbi:MAG: hypothetical protein N3E36_05040 [Sulfolobales archaeon]|nr:hypothetical protein [Sulfolobales archaeon]MCX8199378.1 hypothetical protein [Sulfolobales archaeon]MDW8170308.1 hypothetical protein [Desulfurococcaceae archaeon]
MEHEGKPSLRNIEGLSKLHRLIVEYFIKNISVGELIAIIELRELVKSSKNRDIMGEVDDAIIERNISKALSELVQAGFLERAEGVYNLASHLRNEVRKRRVT